MNLSLSRVRFSLIFENNSDRFIFRKFVNFKYSNSHIIGGSGVDTSKLKPVKGNLEKRKIILPARIIFEKGIEEFVEASKMLKKKKFRRVFYSRRYCKP